VTTLRASRFLETVPFLRGEGDHMFCENRERGRRTQLELTPGFQLGSGAKAGEDCREFSGMRASSSPGRESAGPGEGGRSSLTVSL